MSLKVSANRDRKAASERLKKTVLGEKEQGNPVAGSIKKVREVGSKNINVRLTSSQYGFLNAQQRLTLDTDEYLDNNHNGRRSTTVSNEAGNAIGFLMDMCAEMDSDDYRKWLPELIKKHLGKE